jgi:CheY-like chemotaxis protein
MATVLFIEDDPSWQEIFKELLETAGHDAHRAATCEAAIGLLSGKKKFDVIVFDLHLGTKDLSDNPFVWLGALIDGLQARKLRTPPIIIVTAVGVTTREVARAFADYRGKVFSFFEKADFDPREFMQSIKDAADHFPGRFARPLSFLQLLAYALMMTVIVLSIFGGLLWSVQQIADPKTQQAFLQIGGALIIAVPLFILIFSQKARIEDIISAIARIWRD